MTGTHDIQIDIVSDVVCPWCIVGWRQLEAALSQTRLQAKLRWHPFELNPDMPPEGENLRDHIMRKYGGSRADSDQARNRLTAIGAHLGFAFRFTDDSRIVNTFQAHKLLDAADDLQHALKLALFDSYFTQGQDVSERDVLIAVAERVGLSRAQTDAALDSDTLTQTVRDKERFWTARGINGVPSMIFGGKYLVTGAQGTETYADILRKTVAEAA